MGKKVFKVGEENEQGQGREVQSVFRNSDLSWFIAE